MAQKVRVFAVQNALSPNGERRISVVMTLECPIPRITTEKLGATTISITPGMHTPIPQTPMENKVVIFFTEEEWSGMRNKPNVDDEYQFNIDNDGGITLKRR
jgi:hypothetical protein